MLTDYCMVEEVQAVQVEVREYVLEVWLDLDYGGEPLFEGVQIVCSYFVRQSGNSCGQTLSCAFIPSLLYQVLHCYTYPYLPNATVQWCAAYRTTVCRLQ